MAKRTYEEEFEYVAASHDINMKYYSEMRMHFEQMLVSGKYDVNFYNEIPKRKDFMMTGDFFRLQTGVLICKNEIDFCGKTTFFKGIVSADIAIEKIVYLTLLLRRIEFDSDGEFAEKAYRYIESEGVTPEALLILLSRGIFEHECEIIINIFNNFVDKMNDETKHKWLSLITQRYADTKSLLLLAELQLKYKQYDKVLITLKKIENPSKEVIELISDIGGLTDE